MDNATLREARALAHVLADALSAQIALRQRNVDPGSFALANAEEDAMITLVGLAGLMGCDVLAKRSVLVAAE